MSNNMLNIVICVLQPYGDGCGAQKQGHPGQAQVSTSILFSDYLDSTMTEVIRVGLQDIILSMKSNNEHLFNQNTEIILNLGVEPKSFYISLHTIHH